MCGPARSRRTPYDTGAVARATSVRPPLPGIDLPGIFHVRTVRMPGLSMSGSSGATPFSPACTAIRDSRPSNPRPGRCDRRGFIGLEMVENLVHRGFEVTLVEMLDQVLPPIDQEHARVVEALLKPWGPPGARDGVAGSNRRANGTIDVQTQSGKTYPADLVILALGVLRNDPGKAAGLTIGERGHPCRLTNAHQRSGYPRRRRRHRSQGFRDRPMEFDPLAGRPTAGRIAADVIAGRDSRFRGRPRHLDHRPVRRGHCVDRRQPKRC